MSLISQVLVLLENGELHSFENLKSNSCLAESQIETVLEFLANYGFLQRNFYDGTFRLVPKLVELLRLSEETEC
ncbi:hypothetical protein AC477_00445 [miscellaneous Crenarchaeota group-1 archaeon SG8-32-1]|uniref:ArnR1-like winged helix-turn-helix domain-containing protein n=1 Tax=miscellaneous Crenarchaeota group-1 archaeon SG8-32-1 TaxID=1685124 RepID=A0A0M0C2G2_9ARCH|nr:MAG: hypothetical protein AC477_00445 [miscellaneous Crenarchaeota group-1 archaeon SG8-32-1]